METLLIPNLQKSIFGKKKKKRDLRTARPNKKWTIIEYLTKPKTPVAVW